jgi:hypothetical protein
MEKIFCLKCKSKQSVRDITEKSTSNNRKYVQGLCTVCNTKCNKFLPK